MCVYTIESHLCAIPSKGNTVLIMELIDEDFNFVHDSYNFHLLMKEKKERSLLFDIILLWERLFLFRVISKESILPKLNFLETVSLQKNFVKTHGIICSQVYLLVSCSCFFFTQ